MESTLTKLLLSATMSLRWYEPSQRTTKLIFKLTKLLLWLPSKFALVNSKEFRREVKDDRCYSQESLYSQDNNLVHLTKADDRRITRMKPWTTRITLVIQTWRLKTLSRGNSAAREVTKQLVTSADLLLHYCSNTMLNRGQQVTKLKTWMSNYTCRLNYKKTLKAECWRTFS